MFLKGSFCDRCKSPNLWSLVTGYVTSSKGGRAYSSLQKTKILKNPNRPWMLLRHVSSQPPSTDTTNADGCCSYLSVACDEKSEYSTGDAQSDNKSPQIQLENRGRHFVYEYTAVFLLVLYVTCRLGHTLFKCRLLQGRWLTNCFHYDKSGKHLFRRETSLPRARNE